MGVPSSAPACTPVPPHHILPYPACLFCRRCTWEFWSWMTADSLPWAATGDPSAEAISAAHPGSAYHSCHADAACMSRVRRAGRPMPCQQHSTLCACGHGSAELEDLCLDYGSGQFGQFGQEALAALAQGCRKLRVLSLRGSKQVDDQSLRGLAKGCPSLQELDLHACASVGDLGLHSIVLGCKQVSRPGATPLPRATLPLTHRELGGSG